MPPRRPLSLIYRSFHPRRLLLIFFYLQGDWSPDKVVLLIAARRLRWLEPLSPPIARRACTRRHLRSRSIALRLRDSFYRLGCWHPSKKRDSGSIDQACRELECYYKATVSCRLPRGGIYRTRLTSAQSIAESYINAELIGTRNLCYF